MGRKPRRLTDKYISNLKPGPGRIEVVDGTGLMLGVSTRRVRSFWWVHKVEGKARREPLGLWHEDDPEG